MKRAFDKIKNSKRVKQAIDAAEAAGTVKAGYDASQTAANAVTEEDMVRAAAEIAAILDPTGVSSAVASYTYPKCSKYFPGQRLAGRSSSSTPTSNLRQTRTRTGTRNTNRTRTGTRTASRGKRGKISWVRSKGRIPRNAFYGGKERGRSLAVCSAPYKGSWHPGKVVSGKCHIGWGGKERSIGSFQVLTTKGARFSWTRNARARNKVSGGVERGRALYVCRASYKGGIHPGKVVSRKCNIGWGGKEVALSKYEVLIRR